jgi:hypothetical protein
MNPPCELWACIGRSVLTPGVCIMEGFDDALPMERLAPEINSKVGRGWEHNAASMLQRPVYEVFPQGVLNER